MQSKRDELLDHDADGIREFDNDLPRWWLYGFYVTILFAALYMVNYHVLSQPLIGQSPEAEWRADMDAAKAAAAARAPVTLAGVRAPLTDAVSLARGKAIFEGQNNLCFSCHRADLGGLVGPNLTDDLWIHGCTVQAIAANIETGFPVRGMQPFGSGKPLSDEEVLQVASYVMSKHGTSPDKPKPVDPEREKACK